MIIENETLKKSPDEEDQPPSYDSPNAFRSPYDPGPKWPSNSPTVGHFHRRSLTEPSRQLESLPETSPPPFPPRPDRALTSPTGTSFLKPPQHPLHTRSAESLETLSPPVPLTTSLSAQASYSSLKLASSSAPPSPNGASSTKRGGQDTGKSLLKPDSKSLSKTQKEVITRVQGLLRDAVKANPDATGNPSVVFKTCLDACQSYSLSFPDILQEKYIEDHVPIYWAIVNRGGDHEFIVHMFKYCVPLGDETAGEVRLACLLRGDDTLFQKLRGLEPLSGKEEMFMEESQRDQVCVRMSQGQNDAMAFAVELEIASFHRRMRLAKEVEVEFIARGRLWKLEFSSPHQHNRRSPSWTLTVSLHDESPPTFLNAQLVILDVAISSPLASPQRQLTIDRPSPTSFHAGRAKPRPPVSIVVKDVQEIYAPSKKGKKGRGISVTLDHELVSTTLGAAGSSYLSIDDTLTARFEARLEKPDSQGCIIC